MSADDVSWRADLLRYAADAHLALIGREDLVPLLQSEKAETRLVALRAVGRVGRRDPP